VDRLRASCPLAHPDAALRLTQFSSEQKLTIGMDLGDRWSSYSVLDEAGKIILEQEVPTTRKR
jgi:hypothetical protein